MLTAQSSASASRLLCRCFQLLNRSPALVFRRPSKRQRVASSASADGNAPVTGFDLPRQLTKRLASSAAGHSQQLSAIIGPSTISTAPTTIMGGLNLNLPEQLAFYGAYHNHPLNQLIHFFCVPAILWSIFVWLAAAGPLLPAPPLVPPAWLAPAWAAALQPTNAAFLVAAAYSAFFLLLDLFAGATWALLVGLPLAWSATVFAAEVPRAWAWALGVQILAWYMQIHPGHAILERRKPALMDSLVQAFALAPLFVWYELLFLLGYRPALRAQLKQRVAELIADLNARRQPLTGKQQGSSGG